VAVLKAFREAGVPTVVWLCPVLPFLTDTEENIRAIVELCADAGVTGIVNFGMGLTLRDGNREYFYSCLDRNFPGLKERYIRKYGNAYEIPSPHQKHLLEVFHKTCEEKGICHENQRIFAYLREFEEKRQPQQLSFL
jgi:DNA repair photolyase